MNEATLESVYDHSQCQIEEIVNRYNLFRDEKNKLDLNKIKVSTIPFNLIPSKKRIIINKRKYEDNISALEGFLALKIGQIYHSNTVSNTDLGKLIIANFLGKFIPENKDFRSAYSQLMDMTATSIGYGEQLKAHLSNINRLDKRRKKRIERWMNSTADFHSRKDFLRSRIEKYTGITTLPIIEMSYIYGEFVYRN